MCVCVCVCGGGGGGGACVCVCVCETCEKVLVFQNTCKSWFIPIRDLTKTFTLKFHYFIE